MPNLHVCVCLVVCFFLSADYLELLMKFREIMAHLKYRGWLQVFLFVCFWFFFSLVVFFVCLVLFF